MVRLLPKRGALVLPVTAQEWRDVLDTRLLVEPHCTRSVIDAGADAAVARRARRSADGAARTRPPSGDVAAYVAADRELPRHHRRAPPATRS